MNMVADWKQLPKKRIAESDELYNDALFCYMICTLEEITLEGFHDAKGLV